MVSAVLGGWGVGAGPAPAPLPGAAVLPGGGEITATASGGVGAGVTVACGSLGSWGDWGGSSRGSPPPSLGGAACGPLLSPPLVVGASPRCMRSAGVVGQPREPGAACWQGGGGVGAVREPPLQGAGQGAGGPGGRVVSVRPSALPGRATLRASSGTLGSWPHTAPVRCGAPPPGVARVLILRAGASSSACRDSRRCGQWGLPGHAACRSSCVPLPGVTVLSEGGGTPPRPRGGVEGRRPRGL